MARGESALPVPFPPAGRGPPARQAEPSAYFRIDPDPDRDDRAAGNGSYRIR